MSKITHINSPGLSASLIEITEDTTPAESKEIAWQMMCNAHPHESHDYDPERFWATFQRRCPGVTRQQMIEWLKEDSRGMSEKPILFSGQARFAAKSGARRESD